MDAMVTGRISQEKKARGNAVLAQHGSSASQVINELYDYLIRTNSVPDFHEQTHASNASDSSLLQEYQDFIKETTLLVSPEVWSKLGSTPASDKELLAQALEEKYGLAY